MGRIANLEPTKDTLKKRWCLSIPATLSSTGKRRREYFMSKAKAEARAKELKLLNRQKEGFSHLATPKLMEDAVECDQLAQMYGYAGLREAMVAWSEAFERQKRP